MATKLTKKEHPNYVDVYHSIGGWKACLMVWEAFDDGEGDYTPWNTWFGRKTRALAVADALSWAEAEGIEARV